MTFKGELFPYQPEAVDKMLSRHKVLVAYDMGLGKTVLTIAAIEGLMDSRDIKEPGMVICLSTLKYQWKAAIEKFTEGTSKALVVDGTPAQRSKQYDEAMDWRNTGVDYIIMNYEQVVFDWDRIKVLPRGFVILDEATAIKAFQSKRSKHTKRLADSPFRFALTGTPIENGKPEEVFSIMQFVDSTVLGRYDLFDKTFIVRNHWGGVARYKNLPLFHKLLADACVRKKQSDPDVAPYLPAATHEPPVLIEFDRKSSNLYKKIRNDLMNDLEEAQEMFGKAFNVNAHYGVGYDKVGPEAEARGRIMSKVVCLKMLCSHPLLITQSARKFSDMSGEGSQYAYNLVGDGYLDGVQGSRKLEALVDYVTDFLDADPRNKVVIFATFVGMLDMIAERLGESRCKTYSGKMNAKEKDASKVAFNTYPDIRVLISSDAGGYGVDLPAANLLINYDLPWSAGAAAQRNGRINRASSTWKTIVIQDMLMKDSIEVRQHEALLQKNAVADAIVDGEGIDEQGGMELTLGSLGKFLREFSA